MKFIIEPFFRVGNINIDSDVKTLWSIYGPPKDVDKSDQIGNLYDFGQFKITTDVNDLIESVCLYPNKGSEPIFENTNLFSLNTSALLNKFKNNKIKLEEDEEQSGVYILDLGLIFTVDSLTENGKVIEVAVINRHSLYLYEDE